MLVLDASVILKWLLEDPTSEPDTDKATALIDLLIRGREPILQPVHWLTEVAAVLARITPETAIDDVELLSGLEWPVIDAPHVIRRATELAIKTGAHVFDTLYHAVAMELPDGELVTSDERYFAKAYAEDHIRLLSSWTMPR